MKDLITIFIAAVLLWWVVIWPDNAWADLVFEDNKAMVWIELLSFK